jgi:hypothetical protein
MRQNSTIPGSLKAGSKETLHQAFILADNAE